MALSRDRLVTANGPPKLPQVAKHYVFRRILTSYHFNLLRCCTKGVCRRLHRKKSITWVRLCTKGVCNRPHRKRCAIAAGSVRHGKKANSCCFAADASESAAWSEPHARTMRAPCAHPSRGQLALCRRLVSCAGEYILTSERSLGARPKHH